MVNKNKLFKITKSVDKIILNNCNVIINNKEVKTMGKKKKHKKSKQDKTLNKLILLTVLSLIDKLMDIIQKLLD